MGKVVDKEVDEQIHLGRREKLRASFQRYGLETFNETQVLEFALGMAIPRIDTNPTAHRLINTFGSLDGVISASPAKLKAVAGVGEGAANFLHFLKQFVTYYMGIERKEQKILTPTDAVGVLRPLMDTFDTEQFLVLCLDARGVVLLHQNVRGNLEKVDINIRDIVDIALRVKSASIVFAHNHPNDNVNPSSADVALTRALVNVLEPLGIKIVDHLIFAKELYYSFRQSGVLDVLYREHREFANG